MSVILENGQKRIYWYLNRDLSNMGKGSSWKGGKNTKT